MFTLTTLVHAIGTRSQEVALGQPCEQAELFDPGTEIHVLTKFRLDQGSGEPQFLATEADETQVDEMGGQYSKIIGPS